MRGTYDVDVIAEIGSYAEYTVFSERLRGLGFKEDSREGAPLCRWTHGALTLVYATRLSSPQQPSLHIRVSLGILTPECGLQTFA